MASLLEPEIQFAQRLACNEKPIRTKAIKKLRKYIRVRSQHPTSGFGSEELLKLWKGLFYCLWMQDKPLLQEELSNQISTLIHSFHNIDGQLLYLESFLQTLKREWTGIDRLRMDKFFQLVRFMFRQTFEMLKRKNWESSEVEHFVKLLTAQLLHSGSEAPCGLQLHILDLYMTELAVVGSAELTADQNMIFIEPFCKTAAKTKDVTLFRAICSSIFSSIIEQAPFAIEELLSEVKAEHSSDCDSGQASEEDIPETDSPETSSSKGTWKQMNGNTSDDDECYSQEPGEDDIGPVLQFDYAALADKLFDLASRSSTPSHNRQRLYKIIKVLRDLNEGVFPQVEYPEEVSTDEDDEMFGSRKRMKRRRNRMENVEEVVPATKKSKGSSTLQQDKEDEAADLMESPEKNKKKRKKKKKKTVQGNTESAQQDCVLAQAQSAAEGSEGGLEASQAKAMTQSCISSGEVSEAQSPTPLISEPVTKPDPCSTDATVSAKTRKKGKKVKLATESKVEQDAEITLSSTADSTGPAKKGLKPEESFQKLQGQSHVNGVRTEADLPTTLCEDSVEDDPTTLLEKARDCAGEEASEDAPAPKLKKKKMKGKQEDPTIDAGTILKKKRKNPKACPEKMQCESGVETPAKKKKKLAVDRMDGDVELQLNGSSSGKAAVHRRKIIPVEFEYEAEEVTTLGRDVGEPSTTRTTKKSKKAKTLSSFITFQSNAAVPTPLFCKTKGSLSTPRSTKKKSQTPKSESKKVTFGLKNNKTAEFRKSDRSLLVSPDGSSRVPFDPKQKPKVGVLKSPAKAHTANVKKKKNMKSRTNIPKNSPKIRPSAADFF